MRLFSPRSAPPQIGTKGVICARIPEGTEVFAFRDILKNHKTLVHIALDDKRLQLLKETSAFFLPHITTLTFPAWDAMPYDRTSPRTDILGQRITCLSALAYPDTEKPTLILTTINAVLQRVPPREAMQRASLTLKKGAQISRDTLIAFLSTNAYMRVSTAREPGEFAVRGSIIDIVPSDGADHGLRADFFGDTLEALHQFDTATQLTVHTLERAAILPSNEIVFSDEAIRHFESGYPQAFGVVGISDPLYNHITARKSYPGMEHWLPLFYDKLETLLDYAPHAAISRDHVVEAAATDRFVTIRDHFEAREINLKRALKEQSEDLIYRPLPPESLYFEETEFKNALQKRPLFDLQPFDAEQTDHAYNFSAAPNLAAEAVAQKQSAFDILKQKLSPSQQTAIACFSEVSRNRIEKILGSHHLSFVRCHNFAELEKIKPGVIVTLPLSLPRGFVTPTLAVYSEQDLFGERFTTRAVKKKAAEQFLAEISSYQPGDYLVHRDHGIGQFVGLETVTVSGIAHDCIKLKFDGDDKLYVPVENLDLLSRYGGADEVVVLDKLGLANWQNRKARLKERLKVTAEELLAIAAERELRHADILEKPTGAYDEFCTGFPFVETEDQARTIEEVFNDLRSGKPMDRLVCGDVGFGKTEVALRAAFVVAAEGGQVAIVAPTTLLARQHYLNFQNRFKNTPFTVRMLSRLVTTSDAKKTLHELEEGKVDIVIGTHSLLGKRVQFKKLALMVIDEEQHFGVKQKERLKNLRAETHVLTLTATPIPRTLQLSLAGIREMSLIATPPVDRLAVRTFVLPYDPLVLREAILREYYRSGGIFYVCPRISDLETVEKQLKDLVPEVKIGVAHGQMPPASLEKTIEAFLDKQFHILLSTSIIESGIDMPHANTLIVHRSDRFGLSQLYQLRGRVGRSKIRAYAYFTVPANKTLTDTALKRLEVMQTLDTLGAGFTLASYDMDIRGYGNLLGDEQSGNIKEVGVELYQQMLTEMIEQLRGSKQNVAPAKERFSPQINIGISVLIPENYIPDNDLRLSLYRRISALTTEEELTAFAEEMTDRFGPMPLDAAHLLDVVRLKQLAYASCVSRIDAGEKGATLAFYKNTFPKPEALLNYISRAPQHFKIRPDQTLQIIQQNWTTPEKRIAGLKQHLQAFEKLLA